MDQYGGAKSSGGTSGNAINGVSPNNPNENSSLLHTEMLNRLQR